MSVSKTQRDPPMRTPGRSALDTVRDWLRRNGGRAGAEASVNIVLPVLIYEWMLPQFGSFDSLLGSLAPPLLWGAGCLCIARRIDALSLLAVASILVSLIGLIGGGTPQMMELKQKIPTALIGVALLGSIVLRRPLVYPLALALFERQSPESAKRLRLRHNQAGVFQTITVITATWGMTLLTNCALAAILIFSIPINQYIWLGPLLFYGTIGLLAAWTQWYRRWRLGGASQPSVPE